MTAYDFEVAEAFPTRSAFDMSNLANITFQWSLEDTVGIFPSKGDQVTFPMTKGAGEKSASFDGGGWALKNSSTYYAYYPFSRKYFDSPNRIKNIPYTFEGQKAVYEDENGVVQVGNYDYMYASASTPANGNVNFNFKHLGALARIAITYPETATYTTLRINASEAVFPVEGFYDLTADVVALKPVRYSKTIDIDLDNISGMKGESDILYFMVPPVDLTSLVSLSATLITNNTEGFVVDMEKKNIVAGKAYGWNLSQMGTPNTLYTNLSTNGTANCYIVPEAGSYKFSAVRGNSNTSIGAVATAEVLWETFGTDTAPNAGALVSGVKYSDGSISFDASSEKGNALIAAKDAEGNILWSWHIWLTDKPMDQVYRNSAGVMMDRYLGATSATPGDVGALGLMYQWGRKDPFLGSSSIYESIQAESTLQKWDSESLQSESTQLKWNLVQSDYLNGTIEYAISHPTSFITMNFNNMDWHYTEDGSTDNTRWQSSKTIFDPCPVGYSVPKGGNNGVWRTAFGIDYVDADNNTNINVIIDSNKGVNFRYYLTENQDCWYPTSGYIVEGFIGLTGQESICWSCTPEHENSNSAWYFTAGEEGAIELAIVRSVAFPVRCARE